MSTMSAAMASESARSASWRRALPRVGSARYLTGRVPGRRLMKSPPVSVGSVLTGPRLVRTALAFAARPVELVEERHVALVDDVALDLERRGQLAGLLREGVVEDHEALDLLDLRVLGVGAVHLGLDELAHARLARQRRHRAVLDAVLARPRHDLLLVERDERDGVGTPVAVHDALRDPPHLLHVVLEVRRREVLAAGRDDDVLLASDDRDVAVLVDRREVPGVQPAVHDGAERRVGVLVVAGEDVLPLDEQLAVVGDLELDAAQRLADRAEP